MAPPLPYAQRCEAEGALDPGACPPGLRCVALRGQGVCTRACEQDGDCPLGWCVEGEEGEEGWCFPLTGRVADPCQGPANCQAGLDCLVLPGGAGFCTKPCGLGDPCPPEGRNVCVRMKPATQGQWCLRRCEEAADCGADLSCTALSGGGYGVCFP